MRIGELSDRTGATVRMLRYYEEHGLLGPARTGSGYREYSEDDVLRVRYIRCMLASALPTRVVAQALRFLLDETPEIPEDAAERDRLAGSLRSELEALDERIAVLARSREQLARFLGDVDGGVVGPGRPGSDDVGEVGPAVRRGVPHPVRAAG